MGRGFLVGAVGNHVFSIPARLGEPSFAEVTKLATKFGYEVSRELVRKSFDERTRWPLDLHVYTSFNREGRGRAGSSAWSWPAAYAVCGACNGRGAHSNGHMLPGTSCKRCGGTGHRNKRI